VSATPKPSLPLSFQVIIALAAIALASVAQYAHTILKRDMTSLLFFGAAAIFWVAAFAQQRIASDICLDTRADPPEAQRFQRRKAWPFAIGSFAFAGITFLTSTGNEFTIDNVATWALSIALFLYAFWEPEKSWAEWRLSLRSGYERMLEAFSNGLHLSGRMVLLTFIVLLGVFFYYHNLDGVPGEMDSDHAEKILDVNDVVTNGLRPIFFERNTGREPLEFYLISALVEFGRHPINHMALKLVTATTGLLVIPATFLFVSELFSQDLAFLTATLVAISKWPVTIARMGLRFPFTPVFIAPMVYFLFRALKYQRRNDFLITGFFLGAGLYGYNAFRIAPVLVVVFLALWPLIGHRLERTSVRAYAANSLLIFVFALVIFAPLLRYSVDHPENFWYRVLTRLADQERPVSSEPIGTLGSNAINAVLMFNWTGDEAWPNSIPGDPALDYVSGGLFLLGVVYAVYQLIRFRERSYAFVLVGLAIMLLPTALSLAFPNENPSNARAGGAIPFVFVLVALPLAWLWRSLKQIRPGPAAIGLIVLLLTTIAGINYVRYFRDFDQSYREKSWNSDEVALVIRGFAESVGDYAHAWILLYPHWVDTRNVAINMGRIGWEQTLADVEQTQGHAKDANNKLYVLNPNDAEHLVRLQDIMPNGQLRVFKSRTPGHDFVLWYVPGEIAPDTSLGAR
jgi:uncharacterized membrane protein